VVPVVRLVPDGPFPGGLARVPEAVKPWFQRVLTRWNQGFMAFCGRGAPETMVLRVLV